MATNNYNVAMIAVGIKDLKNKLSYYLRMIKKGEKIVITEREKVIATIVPVERVDEDSKTLPACRRICHVAVLPTDSGGTRH